MKYEILKAGMKSFIQHHDLRKISPSEFKNNIHVILGSAEWNEIQDATIKDIMKLGLYYASEKNQVNEFLKLMKEGFLTEDIANLITVFLTPERLKERVAVIVNEMKLEEANVYLPQSESILKSNSEAAHTAIESKEIAAKYEAIQVVKNLASFQSEDAARRTREQVKSQCETPERSLTY